MTSLRPFWFATSAIAVLAVGGCQSFPVFSTHPSLAPKGLDSETPSAGDASPATLREQPRYQKPVLLTLPKQLASAPTPLEQEASNEQIQALVGPGLVTATLPPQPLPQFLDTAFSDVLKTPYSMGPNVAGRTEIISVGGATNLSRRDFFRLIQTALRTYGLKVYIRGSTVAILDDAAPTSQATEVLRSRSSADTPEGARTVIQIFQLATLEANAVVPLMQDILPPGHPVKVTADPSSNTLIITGPGRDVALAVNALRGFDKPIFAGAKVARFEPAFWSAEAFAKALRDALTAEGFKLTETLLSPRSIVILPMMTNSQVLVFTADQDMMDRVLFWAEQLDRPSSIGDQKTTFIYSVRNTDATSLGALITGQGGATQSIARPPVGVPGTPPATTSTFNSAQSGGAAGGGGTVSSGGTITVDAQGNRILFTGTATQFAQARSLLEQLDVPPAQVLVEVTIAEVTLTDSSRAGLEWFFTRALGNGTINGGTKGGLSIGSSGLNLNFTGPDLTAAFNAFASNNKVNILSRPRLLARSGIEASLQVGSDIPIITSQQASNVQAGGTSSVLQSVSYRQTGIILKLRPIVYGGRVDMEISQEVSSQQSNGNAAISSPVILNRSVSTQISVSDGSTGVISGLIDNSYTKGNSGIPFVKDIPVLGSAFRTDTVDGSKTDLLILVTPHIVRSDEDIADLTGRLTGEINQSFRVGRSSSYTLTSLATGLNVGVGLPPSRPVNALARKTGSASAAKPSTRPVQPRTSGTAPSADPILAPATGRAGP